MSTPVNADGRPTQGGASQPVTVLNPLSVTLTGTIPGTVEVANDSGNPIPVSAADGGLVTQGAKADAAVIDPTVSASVVALLKGDLTLTGTLTETAPATDTASSGLNGRLQRIAQRLTSLLTGIVLAVGQNHIGQVGGTTIEVSDEFARVSDGNIYAVGDVISATVSNTGTTPLRSIVVGAANGATGYLTKFRLMTDQPACVAAIRVHFYTVAAPATVVPGDNVAMGLAYANRAQRIGAIDLPALATELGTVTAARTQDITSRLAFQCDPADNKIYYRLETQTVFTPASGQNFYLAISAERNGS